ncbi:MAG: hypothetical protein ACREV9_09080 [Burkholderiales bacterium]
MHASIQKFLPLASLAATMLIISLAQMTTLDSPSLSGISTALRTILSAETAKQSTPLSGAQTE